jgi:hypothetical protein
MICNIYVKLFDLDELKMFWKCKLESTELIWIILNRHEIKLDTVMDFFKSSVLKLKKSMNLN